MRSRDEIKSFLRNVGQSSLMDRAIQFAKFAHDGQRDKGGSPYIGHLERVAAIAKEKYNDDILTTIAYLHDTVEDGGFTVSDLMMFFPEVVWKVVAVLTRDKNVDRDKYIAEVAKNYLAAKVKVCDLEDNMDLGRIPSPNAKDYARRDHYLGEYRTLNNAIDEFKKKYNAKDLETEVYAGLFL